MTVTSLNIFRKNKDLVDAKYLQMYQDPEVAAEELYNSHSSWWNLQMVILILYTICPADTATNPNLS
jgi:hypothetical protein